MPSLMRDGTHKREDTHARPWARTRTLTGASVLAFDIDNTLVDIITTKRRAINAVIEQLKRRSLPGDPRTLADKMLDHALTHGLDASDLVPSFLRTLGVEDERLGRQGQRLLERFEPGVVKLFPDAIHTLDTLRERGYRLYAITDATGEVVRRRLPSNGLTGRFDGILTLDDTPHGKADTTPFKTVLSRERIPADQLVSIGDHPVRDVSHTIELGGRGILAAYGHRTPGNRVEAPNPPTATIGSLAELLNLLPSRGERAHAPVAFA